MPKPQTGGILDHIQGRDSKCISVSVTRDGTAYYESGHGVVSINLDKAMEYGSGIVHHKNVLQAAIKKGTQKDVENVKRSMEVLLTNGLDPRAIVKENSEAVDAAVKRTR